MSDCVKCPQCKSWIPDADSGLQVHMSTFHAKLPMFRCDECDLLFVSSTAMQSHFLSLHGNRRIKEEDSIGHDSGDRTTNMMQSDTVLRQAFVVSGHGMDPRLKCRICVRQHTNMDELVDHMMNVHRQKETYKCMEGCSKNFATFEELSLHRKEAHWSMTIKSITPRLPQVIEKDTFGPKALDNVVELIQQDTESRPVPSTDTKKVHSRVKERITCAICHQQKVFGTLLILKLLVLTRNSTYVCNECRENDEKPTVQEPSTSQALLHEENSSGNVTASSRSSPQPINAQTLPVSHEELSIEEATVEISSMPSSCNDLLAPDAMFISDQDERDTLDDGLETGPKEDDSDDTIENNASKLPSTEKSIRKIKTEKVTTSTTPRKKPATGEESPEKSTKRSRISQNSSSSSSSMCPSWMSPIIYKAITKGRFKTTKRHACPGGCGQTFRMLNSKACQYELAYYIHCVEQCPDYRALNLLRECKECGLKFLNTRGFKNHEKKVHR